MVISSSFKSLKLTPDKFLKNRPVQLRKVVQNARLVQDCILIVDIDNVSGEIIGYLCTGTCGGDKPCELQIEWNKKKTGGIFYCACEKKRPKYCYLWVKFAYDRKGRPFMKLWGCKGKCEDKKKCTPNRFGDNPRVDTLVCECR